MNAGAALGAALGTLANRERDKLTFVLPARWKAFGDWLEQLIAESTGKEGKGILPVLDEQLSDTIARGQDRVFVVFKHHDEPDSSKAKALIESGHPVIEMEIQEDGDLGVQMFIWEMATAVAAYFMSVNPFDQPDVEATKKHTRAVIADFGGRGKLADEQPALSVRSIEFFGNIHGATLAEAFKSFLQQAKAGDYICLQNYLSPSPDIDKAVGLLREAILEKMALPATHGYGPRYLHSTGQLHKGDSGNGVFIQLTQDFTLDVDIPDALGQEKSSFTFGALKAAQAKGDRQALIEKKRRIIRIHFRKNPADGLKSITEMF